MGIIELYQHVNKVENWPHEGCVPNKQLSSPFDGSESRGIIIDEFKK